jgi:hypothetical protein
MGRSRFHALRATALGMTMVIVCAGSVGSVAAVASAQPRKKPGPAGAPAPPAAASTAAPAGPRPLAQTLTGDAKAAYDAAKLLVGDGDFAGAEIKFKGAYDLSSDPRLLWNIAACEKNQRHYARTIALLRQYLDTGKDLLTDADRHEARALLDAMASFTVKLTVGVSEPGADVFVDDEPVGTSPLDKPVMVDIGSRKITVKKAGFKDATQQVQVGSSSDAKVDVKLEAEVHQGRLSVSSQADARISIDGQVVGTGSYQGRLKSGGHTLRVEADGMRAYQSEVVLADDENRSIDVPLEKIYVPPPPPDSGPSFEVGVSGGPGVKMHADNPWMMTGRVDVGWRPGWPTNLGLYAEYATIDATNTCGTDLHGPAPAQPLDLQLRSSFQSCAYAKAGIELVVHVLPAHAFDPWIAFEPGARLSLYDYVTFDPLSGHSAHNTDTLPDRR